MNTATLYPTQPRRRRPTLSHILPPAADPYDHLAKRYIVQGVLDAIYPTKQVSLAEYRTSVQFVLSTDGRHCLTALGIPARLHPHLIHPQESK